MKGMQQWNSTNKWRWFESHTTGQLNTFCEVSACHTRAADRTYVWAKGEIFVRTYSKIQDTHIIRNVYDANIVKWNTGNGNSGGMDSMA